MSAGGAVQVRLCQRAGSRSCRRGPCRPLLTTTVDRANAALTSSPFVLTVVPRVEGSRPADDPAASDTAQPRDIWPGPVYASPGPRACPAQAREHPLSVPLARHEHGCGSSVNAPAAAPVRPGRRHRACASADVLDDLDEFVQAVTLAAGEVDKLPCSLDNSAAFGRSCDRNTTPTPELEQTLIAEHP